jgi:hypothetical protein
MRKKFWFDIIGYERHDPWHTRYKQAKLIRMLMLLDTFPLKWSSLPYLISHKWSDELHGLLQGVRGVGACVKDEGAKIDVWQEMWISIDLIISTINMSTDSSKKARPFHKLNKRKDFPNLKWSSFFGLCFQINCHLIQGVKHRLHSLKNKKALISYWFCCCCCC